MPAAKLIIVWLPIVLGIVMIGAGGAPHSASGKQTTPLAVTFMDYDLGYFDDEAGRREPIRAAMELP
jgi:hypothetical protein